MTGEAQRSPFPQDVIFVVTGCPSFFRGDIWFGIALLPSLVGSQSIRFAVHPQDGDVMGEPVNQRAGQSLRTEGTGPIVKRQVRYHQRGAMCIAPA